MSDNTLTIDDKVIPFTKGQTIMDAALEAGVYIPHLCHNPEFVPHGSCRLCTVTINNRQRAACTTPAEPDMKVDNNTEDLKTLRKTLLQMLFVEGNHVCPGCEKSGACQLQAIAYYVDMLSPHFTHFFPKRPVDASHPEVMIDFNRCILCELCVRASKTVDKKDIFALSNRGIKTHLIINSESGKLGDTNFSIHDKAAHVCPVGAILPKHKGYDIPIGQRLYDVKPIDIVGDVAAYEQQGEDHEV